MKQQQSSDGQSSLRHLCSNITSKAFGTYQIQPGLTWTGLWCDLDLTWSIEPKKQTRRLINAILHLQVTYKVPGLTKLTVMLRFVYYLQKGQCYLTETSPYHSCNTHLPQNTLAERVCLMHNSHAAQYFSPFIDSLCQTLFFHTNIHGHIHTESKLENICAGTRGVINNMILLCLSQHDNSPESSV